MKVCSLYGAGFYYIPGTDICVKYGGYVRWQKSWGPGFNSISRGPLYNDGNNRQDSVDVAERTRANITWDTRQQTPYGTLRTYWLAGFSQDSTGSVGLYANRGFIQIAGFTFGKATSFFDFYAAAAVAYNAGLVFSPDTGDGGQMLAAYTAQFGNGVSATIAAEEARKRPISFDPAFSVGAAPSSDNFGGAGNLQDIVGNIRVDQAWGSAQVSAAAHYAGGDYYGSTEVGDGLGNIHPSGKWGWAVSGGLRLNAPMIAQGDYFQAGVVYSEGAIGYTAVFPSSAGQIGRYDGNTVGYGFFTDGVFGFDPTTGVPTDVQLTTAWSVAASFQHQWTPNLKTSVYGSYIDVSHNAIAKDLICGAGSAFPDVVADGCDPDWNSWNVGSRTQWNPVKGLYVGLDVIYHKLNTARPNAANLVALPANGAKPAAVYTVDDQDAWFVTWRIQRDVVP